VCCDLSLKGPKHAQQRTIPQDRGVLLVSREEGQGSQSYLGNKVNNTNACERVTYYCPHKSPLCCVASCDTDIKKIRCLPGTIFAPYPLSNAGSLLQLLDAMRSPQKAEMISSLERCGVSLTSSHRKNSQS